ncbi:MAG TPA: hypothetical protein VNL97_02550, partial [Solirubrobacterales bacterium]|nr:hypothetical protein [Solirubrobacterales bacterium]
MKAVAALVALVTLVGASPASAGFEPQNLHVVGGEETWHAERSFELRWSNPAGVATVHYCVLAPSGQVAVADTTIGWPATAIEYLNVPPAPGAYTAEVWLENAAGEPGPAASAKLRFDDVLPGGIELGAVSGWIGRGVFPLTVRIGHPEGSEPISGIRGYAFSIDRDAGGEPCAAPGACSEVETDLRGGVDLDTIAVPALPEGTSYLHAAAVSGSGVRSARTETVALRVDQTDPVTVLLGAGDGWSNRPLQLLARAADSGSGMALGGGFVTPFTAIRVDGAVPVTAPGDSVRATVIASGVHVVSFYARDAAGNVADGVAVNGRWNAPPARATVRIDRDPPSVAFRSAQDPHEPERIEAFVSDRLSGFDPSRGRIAVRPAESRQRFSELPTAGARGALMANWDSGAYRPGLYEFRATAYDLAGNATSTLLRSNGSRMLLRNPLKVPTTLVAGFTRSGAPYAPTESKKRTGREWTVPFGRAAYFGGRLIAGRRSPLPGRSIRVVERFDSGGERITTATSGRDGRFSLRLDPGPSREVIASAAPTATLSGASSRPARLEVMGRVSLRASASVATIGGRPVVFSGRVGATPIPHGGKAVELQFRLPGLPWSE